MQNKKTNQLNPGSTAITQKKRKKKPHFTKESITQTEALKNVWSGVDINSDYGRFTPFSGYSVRI